MIRAESAAGGLLAVALTGLAGCASTPPDVAAVGAAVDIRQALPGRWDWAEASPRCVTTAGSYAFSEDGRVLQVDVPAGAYFGETAVGSTVSYAVLSETERTLRLRTAGETRRTAAGEPVEWQIVMLDADAFCWHRMDWKPGACTGVLRRCSGGS